ncbi:hypothetical protein [Blastococcus sp. PRF04-17]|uniref:hypothetical protein n=1 Tax=Blastococcus sp. PRF04-17 TaxID=2933797 RepID=UPI001FF4965F|nr:hypothetical protein [Blastococcus sp. PRF04-17]UOY01096.1 hypothetical protein MVA48_19375 [Blastococcus sp. PRF04-17]
MPDDAVQQLQWLRGPEGTAAVALAVRLVQDGVDLLPGLDRLRAAVGTDLAGPAWELARLRVRARPVFGADADVLLLTADTLEQAGRPELAARRADRLLAGEDGPVGDLGCAAGTDTVALARAGASVVAVDRDPVARLLTEANVEALGLAGRVRVVDADVVDLVAEGLPGCTAATLDPARRAGDAGNWTPTAGPPRGRRSWNCWTASRRPSSRWRRGWTTTGCPTASRPSGSRSADRSSRRCCGALPARGRGAARRSSTPPPSWS